MRKLCFEGARKKESSGDMYLEGLTAQNSRD